MAHMTSPHDIVEAGRDEQVKLGEGVTDNVPGSAEGGDHSALPPGASARAL